MLLIPMLHIIIGGLEHKDLEIWMFITVWYNTYTTVTPSRKAVPYYEVHCKKKIAVRIYSILLATHAAAQ